MTPQSPNTKIIPYTTLFRSEIAKQRGHKGIASFVNGILRNIQRKGIRSTDQIQDKIKKLSIETSHPEWLIKRWVNHYGFQDRKSTRLNSSHVAISYAVFCLK